MCSVPQQTDPMIKRKKPMPLTASEAARVAIPALPLATLYRPIGPAAVVAALICTKKKVKATKPS
jgi:hypothetical protein